MESLCNFCKSNFIPKRQNQKFCSVNCRVKNHNKNNQPSPLSLEFKRNYLVKKLARTKSEIREFHNLISYEILRCNLTGDFPTGGDSDAEIILIEKYQTEIKNLVILLNDFIQK